ncbi:MAG: hypothetical protein JOZ05_10185 [Acetobacteraceae bacterium]|nr:hypothetical protein [Acetobacteraceae bacterium]
METAFLMIDTVAMLLVLIYSLRNDKLPPGKPETGLFRMAEPKSRAKKDPHALTGRRPIY